VDGDGKIIHAIFYYKAAFNSQEKALLYGFQPPVIRETAVK
jgi:hypothetical protein